MKIWKYISFLLIGAIAGIIAAAKIIKPCSVTNITAKNYIAEYKNEVKKLKQKGEGNFVEISSEIQEKENINQFEIKKKQFLTRFFKSKKKKL